MPRNTSTMEPGSRSIQSFGSLASGRPVFDVRAALADLRDLPTSVVDDKVKAEYRDGILTVTLPKAEEAKPKQITVNVK